ncbi:uncharacterized protein VTP21DRAFT_8864 [Calcarisporiella thermophila]|uniref:uncharacterized protein n=1 Tax=Calcarisporiella thermophila TaxID=911321 RepID=UPI0037424C3D
MTGITPTEQSPLIPPSEQHPETQEEQEHEHDNVPLYFRFLALVCALLLSMGSHFAAHTLSALKSDLKKELGASNSEYGALQSSVSLINSVIPILGGAFVDLFGTARGSLCASALVALGNLIAALSTQTASFRLMVMGRLVYGLGSGVIVIVQETMLSHWFKKRLGFVIGGMLAMTRLASFLANLTVVPIKNATGFYGSAFWFSAAICFLCLILNIIYVILLYRLERQGLLPRNDLSGLRRKRSFRLNNVYTLPGRFWMVVWIELLLGGVWTSFLTIATELVQMRYGRKQELAAYNASVGQALPILLTPFVGMFLDKSGLFVPSAIFSSSAFLASQLALTYIKTTPIPGMVLFSLSLTVGPLCLATSIPRALSLALIGTGFGLFKAANNVGSTILNISVGLIQDATPDKGYGRVVHFLGGVSGIALVSCFIWAGIEKRNALKRDGIERGLVRSRWSVGCAIGLGVLMVFSWALFFLFAVTK